MKSLWLAALALVAVGCTHEQPSGPPVLEPPPCGSRFVECDGDPSTYCETDLGSPTSCGACGRVCPGAPHASGRCDDGLCGGITCDDGWGDCDGDRANGCEARLNTLERCGRCDLRCEVHEGTTTTCREGLCQQVCLDGYANCDGLASNGCEARLATDVSHCGRCDHPCQYFDGEVVACVDGQCAITRCPAGEGDCDGDFSTGCETYLTSDRRHCGACGRACPVAPGQYATCSRGVCSAACGGYYFDCDRDAANGCETYALNNPAHCGGCGRACAPGEECVGDACVAPCPPGVVRCLGDETLRCGSNVSLLRRCGTCDNRCAVIVADATSACVSGACVSRCDPSFADCDGVASNGCEVNLTTNAGDHCGACGRACAVGEACVSGACSLPAPRQWRPQSVSTTTSRRPTFAWHLPSGVDGARLDVCADRACTRVEHTVDVTGESYRPPESVSFTAGVHFWRVWGRVGARVGAAHGPTWEFVAPETEGADDTSRWGFADVDGDGREDSFVSGDVHLTTGAVWRPDRLSEYIPLDGQYADTCLGAFAGDLDGDGYGDLLCDAQLYYQGAGYSFTYTVGRFRGGPSGPVSHRWTRLGTIEVYRPRGSYNSLRVTPLGDTDGDGYADFTAEEVSDL